MSKKHFLVGLVCILFFNMTFAQYGWAEATVYLKNNKILSGEASLTMMYATLNIKKEKLKFRANKKSKKTKYAPQEVDSAVFTITYKEKVNGKRIEKTRIETYVPIPLNKKQTKFGFAELLVDGKLKLVGRTVLVQSGGTWNASAGPPSSPPVFVPGYMGNHNQVMFLKDGEKPAVFNQVSLTKSFRKRAIDYFKDCPELVKKLNSKTLKKEDLQAIVKFYNTKCN